MVLTKKRSDRSILCLLKDKIPNLSFDADTRKKWQMSRCNVLMDAGFVLHRNMLLSVHAACCRHAAEEGVMMRKRGLSLWPGHDAEPGWTVMFDVSEFICTALIFEAGSWVSYKTCRRLNSFRVLFVSLSFLSDDEKGCLEQTLTNVQRWYKEERGTVCKGPDFVHVSLLSSPGEHFWHLGPVRSL